jgi:sialate O-acetylesterase
MRRAFILIFYLLLACTGFAEVRLPGLVSDGMVLQRNVPLNIWGWASPGEAITLQFSKNVYRISTGTDGRWQVALPPMKAGGPFDMQIDGSNHLAVHNIVVGDVWVCSGQSNMVLPMERVKEKYGADIAAGKNEMIRQFLLPVTYEFNNERKDVPGGRWVSADPQTLLQFTAAGYFFARTLFEKYHVPIGLINASVGGSPVEAWMSADALKNFPSYTAKLEPFKNTHYIDSLRTADGALTGAWANAIKQNDAGLNGPVHWYDPSYQTIGWQGFQLPGYWADQGLPATNGTMWFRKEFNVPASMTGVPAKLFLGRIVDADETYVNGQLVGNITYQYPPRRYDLPATLLHAGRNIITVRVINNNGRGGFVPDKPYYLATAKDTIDLKGQWQAHLGTTAPPLRTSGINVSYQPEGLFNAMIAPLTPYAIKGVLWYQGESNADHPGNYGALLMSMITDWRKKWQQDFPFLLVQLPNYGEPRATPGESNWALLREQQQKAATLPNTAMAVAIDIGEWNDIHPLNKKDVGTRLALAAESLAYGEKKVVAAGPVYQSMNISGNKITIYFTNTGSGLIARGGALQQFTIAGSDGRFLPAQASLRNNQVTVWNGSISQPVAVRYAWADNPQGANLYNREGLPAAPFRTDTLPRMNKQVWKKGNCAVALTYDDALNVHIDNAAPLLDSLGLKATFYLSGYSGVLNKRLNEWRTLAREGHELGNHTLFHPCAGNQPGREWVPRDYDLSRYSVTRMVDEIRMTNTILSAIDGRTERSFAYPCGDTKIGDTAYLDGLHAEFTGARGVYPGLKLPQDVDLYNINCYTVNGQSGDELIAEVKKAMQSHTLLVFLFHGVGGEHGLNVSLEAHSRLLHFLQEHQNEIWIAPMTEIASYIHETTGNK